MVVRLKNYLGEVLDVGGSSSNVYLIPFGKLVKGTIANSVVTENASSSIVIMKDAFCMPYAKAILTFHLPSGYTALVYYGNPDGRTGDTTHVSDSVSSSLSDGDTFTFPYNNDTEWHKEYYYRIAFVKTGIQLSDVQTLIANGDISVECDKAEDDVVDMNREEITKVTSLSWDIVLGNDDASTKKYPIIIHVSDIHSDAIRYQRSIKVAEYLGASHINTGDHVAQCAKDGYSWPYELIKDTALFPIVAQGNHDAVLMTQAAFEASFYTDWYNKYGYSRLGAYYYKDDSDHNIRYICLNSCDYTGTDSASTYRINRIAPVQQLWYAQTLLSTPANYKVVVCLHQPLGLISANAQYETFVSERALATSETVANGGSDIINITDAFIGGTSITVNGTSVNFANKNTGAEFVMYLNGHTHADHIGYLASASYLQLQCTIGTDCVFVGKGFTYDYIPRDLGKGKIQDLINAYVVDGDSGVVHIVRIGATMTTTGKVRDEMTIPYK